MRARTLKAVPRLGAGPSWVQPNGCAQLIAKLLAKRSFAQAPEDCADEALHLVLIQWAMSKASCYPRSDPPVPSAASLKLEKR